MSRRNGRDYLYLVWKSESSRKQYIVGQLIRNGQYEFQYADDIADAIRDGFVPLLCFPDLDKVYTNTKLFPVFASRLPDRKRRDIQGILEKYGLEEYDEYLLLKHSGARLPIDSFEFIDPIFDLEGSVRRIFFVAGVRHYLACGGSQCDKSFPVTRGDEVILRRDLDNPHDENAVQMLDVQGRVLGYVPGYYSEGVSKMLASHRRVSCHIYHVDKNKNCNECVKAVLEAEG